MGPNMVQISRRLLIHWIKLKQGHLSNVLIDQQGSTCRYIALKLDIATPIQVIEHSYQRSSHKIARRCVGCGALALRVSSTACLLNNLRDIPKQPDVQPSPQSYFHQLGVLGKQVTQMVIRTEMIHGIRRIRRGWESSGITQRVDI